MQMAPADHKQDLELAHEVCDELRSGNNESILKIYKQYHPLFFGYTSRRIHTIDIDRVSSILNDFWVELLNAKAICDYLGFASLKTYLFKILKFRIVDNIRWQDRKTANSKIISDKEIDMDEFISEDVSPEKDVIHKEKIKLIHETLLMLTNSSASDAYLVKMHLEGLDYTQMAERMLKDTLHSQEQLDKKVSAVKKQFTRTGTGSLAKFKICLENVMRKNNMIHDDMLN